MGCGWWGATEKNRLKLWPQTGDDSIVIKLYDDKIARAPTCLTWGWRYHTEKKKMLQLRSTTKIDENKKSCYFFLYRSPATAEWRWIEFTEARSTTIAIKTQSLFSNFFLHSTISPIDLWLRLELDTREREWMGAQQQHPRVCSTHTRDYVLYTITCIRTKLLCSWWIDCLIQEVYSEVLEFHFSFLFHNNFSLNIHPNSLNVKKKKKVHT